MDSYVSLLQSYYYFFEGVAEFFFINIIICG